MPFDLDHVALATESVGAPLAGLVNAGGTLLSGGPSPAGFRFLQVRMGDADTGMTIELLEPWAVDRNDFLARFLARNGPGAHHITFKVPDIRDALDRLGRSGIEPVSVDLSDPEWKEAFVHPRQSHGTVVQLAQTSPDLPPLPERFASALADGPYGEAWWPEPPPRPAGPPVFLRRVVVATPSLDDGRAFYGDLLGGEVAAESDGFVELKWPGAGRVRLESDASARPRVARLEAEDPDGRRADLDLAGTRIVVTCPS